jgi:hypothetical protein
VNSTTIANWVQIITGIAVVIGLILLIWELQQSRDVASAQLTSDAMDQILQIDLSEAGENPNVALTKACEDPNSLTNEDLWVLQSYYYANVGFILRAFLIEQRTGLYEGIWIEAAYARFEGVFSSRAGRVWWEARRKIYPQEIADLGDSILMAANTSHGCHLDDWRKSIQAGGDFVPG